MKKFSKYYRTMMILFIITFIGGTLLLCATSYPGLSAVLYTASFIFWYGAVMAPDEEKFKET